jgi:ubiquinone biosynthesis protein UbiJ
LEFNKVKIKADSIEMPADSDIKFGDVSLRTLLNDIADRLNVLIPDARLEKEYEELRQAREHYQYVKKKLEMLEKLKNTPVELPK